MEETIEYEEIEEIEEFEEDEEEVCEKEPHKKWNKKLTLSFNSNFHKTILDLSKVEW